MGVCGGDAWSFAKIETLESELTLFRFLLSDNWSTLRFRYGKDPKTWLTQADPPPQSPPGRRTMPQVLFHNTL